MQSVQQRDAPCFSFRQESADSPAGFCRIQPDDPSVAAYRKMASFLDAALVAAA